MRKPPCPGWTTAHNFYCQWDGERYHGYCTECGATAEYDATLGVGRTELRDGSYRARTKEERDGCTD